MSANSAIVLKKLKKGYQIRFQDIESSGYYDKKLFRDLKNALNYAKEIQNTKDLEYGIFIESL